jgi:hypothetical protein
MERTKLESAAAKYPYLKGLFGIPLGLLAILLALGNWEWGPLRHTWVFLGAVLVLGAAWLLINRYYNENYGRVTLSTRQQMRFAVVAIIGAPVFFGASLLARSRADWSLDLPVNPTAALFALLMLASVAVSVGLRAHHVIIWGAVLVAGLLPVWNGADPSNIGLVLAGVAVMATGIFDHRLLVRTFGSSKRLTLENSNAGA